MSKIDEVAALVEKGKAKQIGAAVQRLLWMRDAIPLRS